MRTILSPARGLSSFQLKLIAVICMTLDHLVAFGWSIPLFTPYRVQLLLRTLGRIAAPLFLFVLVQGARHTRSRRRYLLRLYLAGMATGLFVTATNFFFGGFVGFITPGNILFTFFYVILFIELLERLVAAVRSRDTRRALFAAALTVASAAVPHLLSTALYSAIPEGLSTRGLFLAYGLIDSFLPSLLRVEYTVGFVVLGVVLYFAKTKRRQCLAYAAFCLLCIVGRFAIEWDPELYMHVGSFGVTFFESLQCRMWLALPFMMLYNGERGRQSRWFFYWYYPLHRYAISVLAAFFGG